MTALRVTTVLEGKVSPYKHHKCVLYLHLFVIVGMIIVLFFVALLYMYWATLRYLIHYPAIRGQRIRYINVSVAIRIL